MAEPILYSSLDKKTWVGRTSAQSWETLVVFAVGFKELKVMMNMGNVMGNVEWISKNLRYFICEIKF